jgi:hypothetical protein
VRLHRLANLHAPAMDQGQTPNFIGLN